MAPLPIVVLPEIVPVPPKVPSVMFTIPEPVVVLLR